MTANPPKKSDLGVRALSAIVMIAVAGSALWLGSWAWFGFVMLIAFGVLYEWNGLVARFAKSGLSRVLWTLFGVIYVGAAAAMLAAMRANEFGLVLILVLIGGVIGTDIGAYFTGRAIGGPKIAPSISPSKTWAGLGGGIIGAATAGYLGARFSGSDAINWPDLVMFGVGIAVIAQAGDFFESWMKRKAGVKDSGRLIPGHGGLFDRVDGMLPVFFILALTSLASVAGLN